jgi:hypothetical protein
MDQWQKDNGRRNAILKEHNLGAWHIVELTDYETALIMKKYIRTKKV